MLILKNKLNLSNLKNKELIELQKKFRKGLVKEEELSEKQLKGLKDLYREQIKFLEESILTDIKKLEIK